MSTTQQKMTQESVQAKLGSIRQEIARIESDAAFEAQTSGYPQPGSGQQSPSFQQEVTLLTERAEAFAREIRDRASHLAQAQQQVYGNGSSWTGGSAQGQTRSTQRLATVVNQLLQVVEQVATGQNTTS